MDKLNTIAIFISAAQYRSFSEAARRLGMSPSAISKAVQRLEERLGTRLLNRTTRSISLTEDGAVFYQSCRQILSDLEDAELALSHTHAIPSGTLRLSLTLALGQFYIVPALPKLLARYPQLQLARISHKQEKINLHNQKNRYFLIHAQLKCAWEDQLSENKY